jgi:hypothetical protein
MDPAAPTLAQSAENISPPQPLTYGLAAPGGRRRIIRSLLVIAALVLGYSAWRWGPAAWQETQIRYYQRQLLTYNSPADQVVYEEDPAEAAKLLAKPSEFAPFRWDMWAPPEAKMPGPAASRIVPHYQTFEELNGRRMAVPGGTAYETILFLHERTTPKGERRLVKVTLIAAPFSFWAHVIEGDRYQSHTWTHAYRGRVGVVEPFDTRPRHIVKSPDPNPPNLHIYAGQIDPKDASHFTIRYQAWGQEDVMDGYLINNDTVTLKPRNAPKKP